MKGEQKMKKIISIFLLVIGVFSFVGCSDKEVITDVSSLSYLDSSSKENIAYNLELVSNEVKSIKFDGVLKIKENEYKFSGEAIVKGSIEDSLVHINYGKNNLYLKKGNIYLSYFYRNTNVIIKDDIDNFIKEVVVLLENKNINCDENKISKVIKEKELKDINYKTISEYITNEENGLSINYKDSITKLNNYYLPTAFYFSKNDMSVSVNFNYERVSVKVPFGYDLLNSSLDDIKDLLRVNNISELIK